MSCRVVLNSFVVMSLMLAPPAYAVNIASNQGAGQDGFVYSGAPIAVSSFYPVIVVGKTAGAAHDTESLVQFDLSTVGSTAAQVTSATLNLWVSDVTVTGFGLNPDVSNPLQVDLFPATAVWDRSTAQWSTRPATGAQISSVVVTSIGHLISFDVTSAIQSWLSTPSSNFGLLLRADSVVGASGSYHYVAFSSGFGNQSATAPYLTVVPEPASMALAAGLLPLAAAAAWRQRTRRRLAGVR
jgi:hypothetical protein